MTNNSMNVLREIKIKFIIRIIIFWLAIPLALLLSGLFAALVLSPSSSFSMLSIPYNQDSLAKYTSNPLYAHQSVIGKFTAKENNLGIIAVRFYNFNNISNDVVIFRLRQAGSSQWIYENTYKVDQFQPNKLFTFGFPVIANSKGKIYEFDITSIMGKKNDAIGLSTSGPTFVTEYKFTKSELLLNKFNLIKIFAEKLFYSGSDISYSISYLVFLLPFIIYMTRLISARNNIFQIFSKRQDNYILLLIYLLTLLVLINCVYRLNNLVDGVVLMFWVIFIWIYRFDESVSFLTAFLMLIFCALLIIANYLPRANIALLCAYYFFAIGAVQSLLDVVFKWKGLRDYTKVIQELQKSKFLHFKFK